MSESNSSGGGGIFKDAIRNYLAPIAAFLDDDAISEVLINGPDEIFVEVKGKLERRPAQFNSEDSLRAAVNAIAQFVGRRISEHEPRLDARLPEGFRIAAVIPPCSRKGTVVSIRKFTKSKMTFQDYIRLGAITVEGAQFLDLCMFLGKNILVSGGTGSGKTTLLGLLCSRIPPGQRIIVIEDSSELTIEYEHVVPFETKQADVQGKGEVTIRDLLKSSLRLRPDRIIVGEVRSSEALELINAMNTGHKGCMGTVHANSPQDAIVRLEALAAGGDNKLSEKSLRHQVASAIDIILQISRYADGSRRIASIAEVQGMDEQGNYRVVPIFEMSRMLRRKDGKLEGQLLLTGQPPSFASEIYDNIPNFPADFFSKKA